MQIVGVKCQNMRSLADGWIGGFTALTAIVGGNGVGKTNLVKAI